MEDENKSDLLFKAYKLLEKKVLDFRSNIKDPFLLDKYDQYFDILNRQLNNKHENTSTNSSR